MAKSPHKSPETVKERVLYASAKLFLENGYTESTLKSIASEAGVNIGSLMNVFKTKEDILCDLVTQVIDSQFSLTGRLVGQLTDDKVLFYAAETVLQLYITESSEQLRDLYSAAYTMPKTSNIIQQTITGKLEHIFAEYLPDYETKDFYKLEIASGGIMRGFMTVPCDMWFTMEQKVESFLETTFLIYRVPNEKIRQAIEFVSQFDFETVAKQAIQGILNKLQEKGLTL